MTRSTVVVDDRDRKADLAAIHIAKKELGWDDDYYRDILASVCRVRSAGALDSAGRKRFLAHLRACGWSGAPDKRPAQGARPGAAVRAPLTKAQAKMWSLWQQLADAGEIKNRRMPALVEYVQRQCSAERLEWLNGPQEQLVIESLKKWLARAKGEGRGT